MPFRGDAQAIQSLLAGDIAFGATGLSSIRGQSVRPLVVFAEMRHPGWPDTPTAKELGIANAVPPGYNGVYAPKGLPPDILAVLEGGCARAMTSPGVQKALQSTGMSLHHLGSAAFRARVQADYAFKGELIRKLGLAGQ